MSSKRKQFASAPVVLSMRLAAGKHAIKATEAEVRVDGSRIAGGYGSFEFNLFQETWVEVRVIRA